MLLRALCVRLRVSNELSCAVLIDQRDAFDGSRPTTLGCCLLDEFAMSGASLICTQLCRCLCRRRIVVGFCPGERRSDTPLATESPPPGLKNTMAIEGVRPSATGCHRTDIPKMVSRTDRCADAASAVQSVRGRRAASPHRGDQWRRRFTRGARSRLAAVDHDQRPRARSKWVGCEVTRLHYGQRCGCDAVVPNREQSVRCFVMLQFQHRRHKSGHNFAWSLSASVTCR